MKIIVELDGLLEDIVPQRFQVFVKNDAVVVVVGVERGQGKAHKEQNNAGLEHRMTQSAKKKN